MLFDLSESLLSVAGLCYYNNLLFLSGCVCLRTAHDRLLNYRYLVLLICQLGYIELCGITGWPILTIIMIYTRAFLILSIALRLPNRAVNGFVVIVLLQGTVKYFFIFLSMFW
jgi:hypothetical protein